MRRWLLPSVVLLSMVLTTGVVARQGREGGAPQVARPGTAVIAGRVVDAGDGSPIGEAFVTADISVIGVQLSRMPRVATDAQGRFVFRDLPAGTFNVSVSATGYVSGGAGTARPGVSSRPVAVDDGAHVDLVLKLMKYAAISGTVVDEAGEPVCNDTVRIFPYQFVGGRRKLAFDYGGVVQTDDRGLFRASSLVPGDYVVVHVASPVSMPASALVEAEQARAGGSVANQAYMRELSSSGATMLSAPGSVVGDWRLSYGTSARPPAPSDDGRVFVYPTVFFPGTASAAGAATITVKSGEERTGVNFQLRPAPAVRVSGTVVGPTGTVARLGLRLLSADVDQFASESTIDPAVTMTDATGAFTFLGISPGSYTLKAVKMPIRLDSGDDPAGPSLWAVMPLQVGDTDVAGVTVTLRAGAHVSGRLEFSGTSAPPAPARLQSTVEITMAPSATANTPFSFFRTWRGGADTNGTFASAQLPPGRYFISSTTAFPGWTFDAVIVNGRDVLDVPVEIGSTDLTDVVIRFTDRPARLTGTVRDPQPSHDAADLVAVFPVDSRLWVDYGTYPRRVRLITTTPAGAFTLSPMAVGEYYVAALRDVDAGAWPDPKFLERLSRVATRVAIGAGESKSVDVALSVIH